MKSIDLNVNKHKTHFLALDGLRGIAAIAVLIFHFAEIVFPDLSDNFIPHGFLAVDFFFCLSGFVIAYAYQDRIANMRLKDFFISRLIRLHPLVVLGSILGLLSFLLDPIATYRSLYSFGQIVVYFTTSILLVPYPYMEERYFNLFNLNAPAWSLFWEYVVNIAYALILFRLTRYSMLFLWLIGAACLIYVGYTSGNLLGGWNGDTFWHGGARVLYSFTTGMLIFRYNLIIKNNIGFIGLSLLLVLAFLVPYNQMSWITELFIVLIYFPFIIALGAGTSISEKISAACSFLGNVSYPLYTTHYFVMWIFGGYVSAYHPVGFTLIGVTILTAIFLIVLAHFVYRYYDLPVRNYLNHLRNKNNKS